VTLVHAGSSIVVGYVDYPPGYGRGFFTIEIFYDATRGQCGREEWWPNKAHNLVCGDCKVLVDKIYDVYKSCNGYCESIERVCTGAWEAAHSDTCEEEHRMPCHEELETSDAICECGDGPQAAGFEPHYERKKITLKDVDIGDDDDADGGNFRLFEVDENRFALWHDNDEPPKGSHVKVFSVHAQFLEPENPREQFWQGQPPPDGITCHSDEDCPTSGACASHPVCWTQETPSNQYTGDPRSHYCVEQILPGEFGTSMEACSPDMRGDIPGPEWPYIGCHYGNPEGDIAGKPVSQRYCQKSRGPGGGHLISSHRVIDSYTNPRSSGLCVSGDVLAFAAQSGGPDSLHYGVLNMRTNEIKLGVLSSTEPETTTCVAHPEGFSMFWTDDESESIRQRFVYLDGTLGQHTVHVDTGSSASPDAGTFSLFQACPVPGKPYSVLLYETYARDRIHALYLARGFINAVATTVKKTDGHRTTFTNWGATELKMTAVAV